MRTRVFDSRGVSPSTTKVHYYKSNGTFFVSENWTNGTIASGIYSSLTDDPSGGRKRKRYRCKYAEHHKVTTDVYPISGTFSFAAPWTPGLGTYILNGFRPIIPFATGNQWSPPGSLVSEALVEANNYFASGCTVQRLDLSAFLFELPDLRSLWPQLLEFKTAFLRKYADGGSFRGLKRDAKAAANAELAYQFGVAPLISDILAIRKSLQGLSEHLKWLRKNDQKPVRVEFAKSLNMTQPPDDAPVNNGMYRKYNVQRCRFKAFAIITYDLSGLSDLEIQARTLCNAFGFDKPLSTLYELTRYSFVLDWFLRVGPLLDRLRLPIDIPYVIQDSGYWTKVETERTWYYNNYLSYGNPTKIVAKETIKGFSRRVGLAVPSASLDLTNPSIKQWLLGGCLAIQRT